MKTMWNLYLGAVVLTAAVLGGGCASFEEELFEVSVTVEEIEGKMVQAQDPTGRFAKAKSYVQRQISEEIRIVEDESEEMLTDVKFMVPDKMVIVNYVDNQPRTGTIINGTRGWSVDYAKRRSEELNEEQMRLISVLTRIANPGVLPSEVFGDIVVSGSRVADKEYYKLSCWLDRENQRLPSIDIYIDREEYLVRMYRIGEIISRMVHYGLRDGVLIPIEVESTVNRRRTRVTVTDYKLDVSIPTDEFYPPVF